MRVMFRFKPDAVNEPDNKAWIGFAEGYTWEDVADVIDEFGDPASADIVMLPETYRMGFCIPYVYINECSPDEYYWCTTGDREVSDWFFEYDVDDPRWETERVSLEELEAFA